MKKLIGIFLVAAMGAIAGVSVTRLFFQNEYLYVREEPSLRLANYPSSTGATVVENPDFISASSIATPAVVHIKSYYQMNSKSYDPFGSIFGSPYGQKQGRTAGSGVIISSDGYIATNNHVVKNADKLEVVLNDKRSYTAKIIGTDPTTDLALIKIEDEELPFLNFGNSNAVQIGEWVLAVGNPFNLTSTVTAGIVSAKGRSLNLLEEDFAIESFIQTDAAVNPGNSGGALINTKGELVGINTAIASETGSYAGYSFAVPVNIVKKVMKDLKEFGEVQRGLIGVQISNINAEFKEEHGLSTLEGAYISGIFDGSAADKAGIRAGDIITKINDEKVGSAAELQEIIGTFRPGEKVGITLRRGENILNLPVTLQDKNGNTDRVMKEEKSDAATASLRLGANLQALTSQEKEALQIPNGVRVRNLKEGKLKSEGIEEGFVITRVNKQFVKSPEEVREILENADGTVLLEGITDSGKRQFFAFTMN